jgi:GT2 family glycosyltransferase
MENEVGMGLLLICVNYHADVETVQWVEAVRRQPESEAVKIVVVDNTPRDAGDDFGAQLQKQSDAIQWMPAPENLGYFGGARFGLERFLEKSPLPEWVMLSNVDLAFGDTPFFDRLLRMDWDERVGVVAPAIRSALSGREQNPCMIRRPSAGRMHFIKWVTGTFPRLCLYEWGSRWKARLAGRVRPIQTPEPAQVVYAPHGSCLLFRKRYFEGGGTLHYPSFLFGEEIFVAETARALGLQVYYQPALQIVHREHLTTGRRPTRRMAAYVAASSAYCADTYFGKSS